MTQSTFAAGYQDALFDLTAAIANGGLDGALRWIADNAADKPTRQAALDRLASSVIGLNHTNEEDA